MIKMLLEEIYDWMNAFIAFIPGRIGRFVRNLYYRYQFFKYGAKVSLGRGVEISSPQTISFGDEVYIVDSAVIRAVGGKISVGNRFALNGNARLIADCEGEIVIGDGVMIGPNTVIRASNHVTKSIEIPIWEQGQTGGRVLIGNNVWIGANVVVVANVTIGSHVVIAAGAVVTKDIPDYAIAAGVPAKVIRFRE